MLKKRVRTLASVITCGAISLLTSCQSSKTFVQPSLTQTVSRHPGMLDNLATVNGNRPFAMSDATGSNGAAIDVSLTNTLQIQFAGLLKVLPRSITNFPLYNFVEEWYGTRYRLGGTDKRGIDCSSFVQHLYERVYGMNLFRTAFEQFNMSNLLWKFTDLKEGDLVFFRIHGSKISHVGVYLMNNCFVHASSSKGVMISSLNEDYWQKYYACGGRVL